MNKLKETWPILKETISEWIDDKAPRLSAALAYYTIFSIAPILIISIAIVGLVFGQKAAEGQIQQQIHEFIGPQGAKAVQNLVAHRQSHGTGILSTVLGFAALLFGATGVFTELHDSLNTVWEVEPGPGSGLKQTVRQKVLSFVLVLGIGFLLLVSLIVSAALVAMGHYLNGVFPGLYIIVRAGSFIVSFAVITVLFAMIYKILPDVEISWSDVWTGAAMTSLLFVAGKFLIGIYIGQSGISSSYGAAGALVLLLLWVYYSAMVVLFGAELTQVYARHFGSRIVPSAEAVPVPDSSRLRETTTSAKPQEQEREGGIQAEPVPQRPRERPAVIGSFPSFILGIVLGLFYSLRRKKTW